MFSFRYFNKPLPRKRNSTESNLKVYVKDSQEFAFLVENNLDQCMIYSLEKSPRTWKNPSGLTVTMAEKKSDDWRELFTTLSNAGYEQVYSENLQPDRVDTFIDSIRATLKDSILINDLGYYIKEAASKAGISLHLRNDTSCKIS